MLRKQRVLLDADLATLYGVETKVLLQAVKRNLERFPEDFMFQLNAGGVERFEVTICDLKRQTRRTRWPPICAVCVYRTGRGDAFVNTEQPASRASQHRDHAGVRKTARTCHDTSRPRQTTQRTGRENRLDGDATRYLCAQYARSTQAGVRCHPGVDDTARANEETAYRIYRRRGKAEEKRLKANLRGGITIALESAKMKSKTELDPLWFQAGRAPRDCSLTNTFLRPVYNSQFGNTQEDFVPIAEFHG